MSQLANRSVEALRGVGPKLRDKLAEWYDSRLLERTRALYADDYAMLQRLGVDL